jgi:hypothetical protein
LGEDTIHYLYYFYHATPNFFDINLDTLLLSGQPPLWIILNSIVKTLGGRFFVVQIIQATILSVLILRYFEKHSPYPFACATLFFFWRYQWYSMVVMKAAIALSIILFANDYFLEKKYPKGILLVLLATGFHQSSVLLVIVPFLTFLRFNRLGIVLLVFSLFVSAILQSKLGDIFAMMEFSEGVSNKLDSYMDSGSMSQQHNLNYFLIKVFPIIVYPILSIAYLKRNCQNSKTLKLEPFLMIALVFQIMQFNINIMYRYVYVFTPYFIIFIVQYIIDFSKNSSGLKRSLAYVRTFALLLPLFASLHYLYPMNQVSFNPYSSIIEKSIYKDREKYFAEVKELYSLNLDEY